MLEHKEACFKDRIKNSDRIAIIADDLTGANDSGIQFTKKGFSTSVVWDEEALGNKELSSDVLVIDTNSRSLDPSKAYKKVYKYAETLKEMGFQQIYKKIDSTLRGNVGTEIQAVMDVFNYDFAIIVPAYPQMGRTTKKGDHYVWGTPLHMTEFANSINHAVNESNIRKLLSSQTKQKMACINIRDLNININKWKLKIEHFKQEGVKWLIFDVEDNFHLTRITNIFKRLSLPVIWIGSAGLAEYIQYENKHLSGEIEKNKKTGAVQEEPVLVVSGSVSPVNQKQVHELLKSSSLLPIEFPPLSILNGSAMQRIDELLVQIKGALTSRKDVIVYTSFNSKQINDSQKYIFEYSLSNYDANIIISDFLGEIVKRILDLHPLNNLILTGGETAKQICEYIDAIGIKLVKEVEPGIPLGRLVCKHPLNVITKAGAFGDKRTLVRSVQILKS